MPTGYNLTYDLTKATVPIKQVGTESPQWTLFSMHTKSASLGMKARTTYLLKYRRSNDIQLILFSLFSDFCCVWSLPKKKKLCLVQWAHILYFFSLENTTKVLYSWNIAKDKKNMSFLFGLRLSFLSSFITYAGTMKVGSSTLVRFYETVALTTNRSN